MNPEEKHLTELVITKYGHFLEDHEIAHVKESVEDIINNARALRNVDLSNGMEPFSVFSPFAETAECDSGEIHDE